MTEQKEIMICPNHEEYQVPMIKTLVFSGADKWCPYCGDTGSVFYRKSVPMTPELERRKKKYEDITQEYLNAKTTLTCFVYLGKRVTSSEIPEKVKKRCQEIINNGWKKNTKAEEIKQTNNYTLFDIN